MQFSAAATALNLPIAQSMQAAAPTSGLYFPAAQLSQETIAVPSANVPAAQSVQAPAPAEPEFGLCLPAPQSTHAVDELESSSTCPAAQVPQSVEAVELGLEYEPTGHSPAHSVTPVLSLNRPDGQAVHGVEGSLSSSILPEGQASHAVDPSPTAGALAPPLARSMQRAFRPVCEPPQLQLPAGFPYASPLW